VNNLSTDSEYLKGRVKEVVEAVKELERLTSKPFDELEGERKERIMGKLKQMFEDDERIVLAYNFGSSTRRSKVRDIDIAVYAYPALTFDLLLDLNAQIELAVRIPVDLVQLQDVNPSLRLRILIQGLPLVMKNRILHYALLAQAFSELQDFRMRLRFVSSYPG
jgi:predicted nucleotidyltransferase